MRLLVTNDDGIESEGIQVLARHLVAAGHEVVVVAPDRNYSGAGAALGDLRPDVPLAVAPVRIDGLTDTEAWSLEGPPALAVVAARLGAFGEQPELVVSGINAGLNTGRSILHSGTVGAVLTAQNFGLSGLAVSIGESDPWHWDTAASLATEVLELVVRGPARSAVNLNVPGLPRSEVDGTRWGRLAPFGAVRAAVSSRSDEQIQFELQATGQAPDADTDQGIVDRGGAALTALVGVVEAWPDEDESEVPGPEVEFRSELAPGATLHPVHEIPGGANPRLIRPAGHQTS